MALALAEFRVLPFYSVSTMQTVYICASAKSAAYELPFSLWPPCLCVSNIPCGTPHRGASVRLPISGGGRCATTPGSWGTWPELILRLRFVGPQPTAWRPWLAWSLLMS